MAEVNKTNLRLVTRLIESGITSEKQIMAAPPAGSCFA